MQRRIQRILWVCAGAHVDLLQECPSDHAMMSSIGAAVLFTGILAWLSGGYALFTIFGTYTASVSAGALWGAIIFNLDRAIVSSMRKRASRKDEVPAALVRLVVAVLIAGVIVVPLELRIFESEINVELLRFQQDLRREAATEPPHAAIGRIDAELESQEVLRSGLIRERGLVQESLLAKECDSLSERRRKLVADVHSLEDRLADQEEQADLERAGLLKDPEGPGPKYRKAMKKVGVTNKKLGQKRALLGDLEDVWASRGCMTITSTLDGQLADADARLADLRSTRDEIRKVDAKRRKEFNARVDASDSFLNRIIALGRLIQAHAVADWAQLLLRLLIIAVETSPVLVRLLSPRGVYDARLEEMEP